MNEPKKSKNPFVNMANDAKKNNQLHPGLGKAPKQTGPKPNTKGFGGANMVKRSSRGG